MSSLKQLNGSRRGKFVLAIVTFALILGGWTAYQFYLKRSATLPGAQADAGPCALWFVGSSSIHRWISLKQDMAPWVAMNRGIDDANYTDILPLFAHSAREGRPAAIILYAGENDLARGVPIRTVVRNLGQFLELRREAMGDVPVLVLSMKPSPGRWGNFRAQQRFNAAARHLLPRMTSAHYVDITTPLLTDGRTGDNYRADGVHMNAAGYRIWADQVRTRLRDALPAETLRSCELNRRS